MSPLCRKSNRCAACAALFMHSLLCVPLFLGASIAYKIPDVPAVESMYITLGEAVSAPLPLGETTDVPLPQPEQIDTAPEPSKPEPDAVSVKAKPEPAAESKAESKPKPATKAQQPRKQAMQKSYGRPSGAAEATDAGGGKAGQQARMNAISALLARLEKEKRYPNSARRMGLEGQVFINVELDKQGAIRSYRLDAASAHPILQKSAMQAMERVCKKWQPVAISDAVTVQIPVRFQLH